MSSCPTGWALSQELRDLGPLSTRAPHPTACPHLLPWPGPSDSGSPPGALRLGRCWKREGEVGRDPGPVRYCHSLPECWWESPPLPGSQVPHLSALASQPCSSAAFPSQEQADLFSHFQPGSLFLSCTASTHTPRAVSKPFGIGPGSHSVWALPSPHWSLCFWPCPCSL